MDGWNQQCILSWQRSMRQNKDWNEDTEVNELIVGDIKYVQGAK